MNALELRDQWGYSETRKNSQIKFCVSISEETKTADKSSSRNSTLGETKLTFVYENNRKKVGSIGWQNENNIIWFLGSVFFEEILFCIENTEGKR